VIGVVLALLIVPLAAGIICAIRPARTVRVATAVTVASGIGCFALAL
jgi:Ca2+/H+ antiporter